MPKHKHNNYYVHIMSIRNPKHKQNKRQPPCPGGIQSDRAHHEHQLPFPFALNGRSTSNASISRSVPEVSKPNRTHQLPLAMRITSVPDVSKQTVRTMSISCHFPCAWTAKSTKLCKHQPRCPGGIKLNPHRNHQSISCDLPCGVQGQERKQHRHTSSINRPVQEVQTRPCES